MNKITLCLLAALILAACSKEEVPGFDMRQKLRLTSGIEAVTRADVQNTQIVANERCGHGCPMPTRARHSTMQSS